MALQTLFNLSEVEKRKTANQTEFENDNIDLLSLFPEIVSRSFEKMNDKISTIPIHSRNKNLKSTLVNGFITGELLEIFPHLCGDANKVRFKLRGSRGEWIYVKKFTGRRKRPNNINTVDNTKIYNQLSDSQMDVSPNIFIGYTANSNMTQETGCYAVCIDGDNHIWESDLSTIVKSNVRVSAPIEKETAIAEGVVKIKQKKIGS